MGTTGMWVRKVDLSTGSDPLTLVLVEGTDRRKVVLDHFPFTVGRLKDRDLVLVDPRVSREHAVFTREVDGVYIEDKGSRQGTFVNNERTDRRRLMRNDRLEFGVQGASFVLFNPDRSDSSIAQQFMSQLSSWKPSTGAGSDLELLNKFLDAARKLNNANVLDDVLHTLLEFSLGLTKAERGFVFLRDATTGEFIMTAGRNKGGEKIYDDSTISKSVLRDAAGSNSEFLVTDTSQAEQLLNRQSVVAQNLKSIICIPLRRSGMRPGETAKPNVADLLGVMYLDSHFLAGKLTSVSQDILRNIANGAAALVENAALVEAEEAARRVQQEMQIAAEIQQRLMAVIVPEVSYARVQAVSYACKDIGGDFFDLVQTDMGLSLIVADVSGKGVSAAVVASILQGMLYSHLAEDAALSKTIGTVNRFLFEKIGGQKYTTLVIARISPTGEMELMNCGHVPPVWVSGEKVIKLEDGNLPVGLIPFAQFQSIKHQLKPGDRLVVVTDGVTEAEDATGEFFGNDRLEKCCPGGFEGIERAVPAFRGATPLSDDCTMTEVLFRGV